MKKHYMIEISLMIIILVLTTLLIVDYYNGPTKTDLQEEKRMEKEKNESLLSIGYLRLQELETYLGNTLNTKSAKVSGNCFEFQNITNQPKFLTTTATKEINNHIFSSTNETGKISGTNPNLYCPTNTSKDYSNWIANETILNIPSDRKELSMKDYSEDHNYLIFEIKYYQNEIKTDGTIQLVLQKENNEWKINQFWR